MADTKIWVGTDTGHEGDINTAANWSPSGVPVATDHVYFENSSQSVTDGLDALAAVTLGSLTIAQSFTGAIGTASAYLQAAASVVTIGRHSGPGSPTGSGRLMLDLRSVQTAVTIHNSGTSLDTNKPPIRIINTHASSVLTVRKGKVGIAANSTGETSQFATINVAYDTSKDADAEVYIGSGVTLATLNQTGGKVQLNCAATTVNTEGGTLLTEGSGAIGTINAYAGTLTLNSTGTITTLNIVRGGTAKVDFSKSPAARTVTTVKLEVGGELAYDVDAITITNKVASDNPVRLKASNI